MLIRVIVPGFAASAALLGLLILFLGVNLHNVVTGVRERRGKVRGAEAPSPIGFWVTLASIGTISFFVEAAAYGLLGLLGYGDPIQIVLVPILAVVGYVRLVDTEENLLFARFKDE